MIQFAGQVILLDIEGTTSSISYVYDTMFPYVREHLESFVAQHWNQAELNAVIDQLASESDTTAAGWLDNLDSQEAQSVVISKVIEQMDNDLKTTGLKNLQGQIWKAGFESGQLVGHLFDDVAPAIEDWTKSGKHVYIYSSGSIAAQKLYFGNSQAGNLLPKIVGHFDTTIGNKREAASYQAIAESIQCEPSNILFISDVVAELDAAASIGFATALSFRPGNPDADPNNHQAINGFDEISIQ